MLRLHESLQHGNLLEKFVYDFRARDFAGFFEKSLNEGSNLGALQTCGLQAGEDLCSGSDGTTQAGKQPSCVRGSHGGNLRKEGPRPRNLSHNLFKLGACYAFPGEFKEDLDPFADDWFRDTQSFTDDIDDLVHASVREGRLQSGCVSTQDPLDRIGGGMAFGKVRQDDLATVSFDDLASTHVVRPIVALDENMRENRFDERARFVFEDNDAIDGAQSGENNGAVHLRVDRPSGAFGAAHRGIAIQPDNQRVTLSARKLEVLDMTAMQDVEASV